MARTGVVDRDAAANLQAGHQQLVLLGEKPVVVAAEQRVDLTDRDVDVPLAQLLVQQRLGDVAVMVLVEHVATKLRAEVPAVEARRQLAEQQCSVRCLPDLPAIAGVVGLDAHVLHDEIAIACEARVLGNGERRCKLDRLMDRQLPGLAVLGRPGTLARLAISTVNVVVDTVVIFVPVGVTARITVGLGLGFHSARFKLRLCFLSLEHGYFVAHLLDDLCLLAVFLKQMLDLAQQLLHQRAPLGVGNVR